MPKGEEGGGGNYTVTPFGATVGKLNGDNELWLALATTSDALSALETPAQLAAAVSCVVADGMRNDKLVAFGPTDPVADCVFELQAVKDDLKEAQSNAGLDLPITLDETYSGLVESFVLGAAWKDIRASTELDEGDIVRLFRRTCEFLAGLPHVPGVSDAVKDMAMVAAEEMSRDPVKEIEEEGDGGGGGAAVRVGA